MKWQREWATPQTTVVKLIGFHAGESERVAGAPEADQLLRRYPLIEWAWDYEDCIAAIERAGMPLPGKSACFFCPSSKAHEIIALPKDLLARALEMERRAMSGEVGEASRCGLGRYFTWRDLIRDHEAQPDLFTITPEECSTEGCFT